jgi:hypothetical protein
MVKNIIVKLRRYKIELNRFLRFQIQEHYSETMESGVYTHLSEIEILEIKKEIKRVTLTIQQYDKFRKIR